jgi:hypothetical protein
MEDAKCLFHDFAVMNKPDNIEDETGKLYVPNANMLYNQT